MTTAVASRWPARTAGIEPQHLHISTDLAEASDPQHLCRERHVMELELEDGATLQGTVPVLVPLPEDLSKLAEEPENQLTQLTSRRASLS